MNTKFLVILIACASLLTEEAKAQAVDGKNNIPTTVSNPTVAAPYPQLSNLSNTTSRNYIRTYIPQIPITNASSITLSQINQSGSALNMPVTTQYFDDIGRPIQEVVRSNDNNTYDLVSVHVYDNMGRENVKYASYSYVDNILNRGQLKITPLTQLSALYNQFYLGENAYSLAKYDNSPLNRVKTEFKPGKSWVGSGNGVNYDYRTNEANEDVRIWTIGADPSDIPVMLGAYDPGTLEVHAIIDEDQKQVLEFKNKLGQTILKKQYLFDGHSPSYSGWLCTYFVYDDLGNLRSIIPPAVVAQLANNGWNVAPFAANCYISYFDEFGRQAVTSTPENAPEYTIYDQWDRPVLSQDGNLRTSGQWHFTAYDGIGRPVQTGLVSNTNSRSSLATELGQNNSYPSGSILNTLNNQQFEDYPEYYGDGNILTETYYDGYDLPFFSGRTFDASLNSRFSGQSPYAVNPQASMHTRGLVTGMRAQVLNSNGNVPWINSVTYFDDHGRELQRQSNNLSGSDDISTNQYDFSGTLAGTCYDHKNPNAVSTDPNDPDMFKEAIVIKRFTKDYNSGRVTSEQQSINGAPFTTIAATTLDPFGRIKTKALNAFPILYTYNVQGWLTGINAAYIDGTAGDTGPFFGEQIAYDKGFTSKLYNGNAAGMIWKGAGTGAQKRFYGYSYDKANRLTWAEFGQWESSANQWDKSNTDYSVSNITYNQNGNLLTQTQKGPGYVSSSSSISMVDMDVLQYTYPSVVSNKLSSVTDQNSGTTTIGPDFHDGSNSGNDYEYDDNGNLTRDWNKNISSITYNYLDKPQHIEVDGKGTIDFIYDATGNRLQKIVHDDNSQQDIRTDYIGNFIYQNDSLQCVLTSEGRCRPKLLEVSGAADFDYDYFIKDHITNVRAVVNCQSVNGYDYLNTAPAIYHADLEVSAANTESLVWNHLDEVRSDKPESTDPYDTKAAELIGTESTKRIGPALMLRVMPGDVFNLSATSYQDAISTQANVNPNDLANSIFSTLAGGGLINGTPVAEMPEKMQIIQNTVGNPSFATLYANMLQSNYDEKRPAAYLNYITFDENFNLMTDNSGVVQASGLSGQWNNFGTDGNIEIMRPGYLLVFVSSISQSSVFVDKVNLNHYKGAVLEENHYYPFGLTLTSTAEVQSGNKIKLTSKELIPDLDLNWYDYGSRQMDEQIGRFTSIDPQATRTTAISPYTFNKNNPITNIDPDGEFSFTITGDALVQNGITDVIGFGNYLLSFFSKVEEFGEQNQDVYMGLGHITGLSSDQIKNDFKAGSGPTFNLGGAKPYFETQDPDKKTINIAIEDFALLYKEHQNHKESEEYYRSVGALFYVLHEYGHYGDKVTNHGNNSGQKIDDFLIPYASSNAGEWRKGDLKMSSDFTGWQNSKSLSGHRGTDVDWLLTMNGPLTTGSGSFTRITYLNPDFKVNYTFKQLVDKSKRFGPFDIHHSYKKENPFK